MAWLADFLAVCLSACLRGSRVRARNAHVVASYCLLTESFSTNYHHDPLPAPSIQTSKLVLA
eukprot:375913-Pleurochrysis_carterae.AAC.1